MAALCAERNGADLEHSPAYTYARDPLHIDGVGQGRGRGCLRIEVAGAVRVAGQLQSHPRKFLAHLFRSRAAFGPGRNHGRQRPSAPQHQAVHELLSQRSSLHGISRDFQLTYYAG